MKLSVGKSGKEFGPHPETDGLVKATIVDITPLKMMPSSYGEREVFKLVYETEVIDENDRNGLLWSIPYRPSLNERANLRKDLKRIRGRDLNKEEEQEFDVESMIRFGVQLIVKHEVRDDRTYAQISFIQPDKSSTPYVASGTYKRVKDREEQQSGTYRKGEGSTDPENEGRRDWQKVVIHVGRHVGLAVGDLDEEAVQNLIDHWIPSLADKKLTAADSRLKGALAEAATLLDGPF
jgi:hypothetical protein